MIGDPDPYRCPSCGAWMIAELARCGSCARPNTPGDVPHRRGARLDSSARRSESRAREALAKDAP